jgi:hypothetical protein
MERVSEVNLGLKTKSLDQLNHLLNYIYMDIADNLQDISNTNDIRLFKGYETILFNILAKLIKKVRGFDEVYQNKIYENVEYIFTNSEAQIINRTISSIRRIKRFNFVPNDIRYMSKLLSNMEHICYSLNTRTLNEIR